MSTDKELTDSCTDTVSDVDLCAYIADLAKGLVDMLKGRELSHLTALLSLVHNHALQEKRRLVAEGSLRPWAAE